jgi:hypothetical protein
MRTSRLSFALVCAAYVLGLLAGCKPPDSGAPEDFTEPARVYTSRSDLPAAGPSSVGQLVFVIDEAEFYYSDGAAWIHIDLQGPPGADGSDGTSIDWRGAFAAPPASPDLDWAYYNTTDRVAYIWDGDSWEILCQDLDAQSLNVQGIVAPGSYLALTHNLGRDDLTFTAQFLKYGYIYDYNDYAWLFGGGMEQSTAMVFESSATSFISTTILADGNTLIAYRDEANSGYGTLVVINPAGSVVAGPTVFETASTLNVSATALQNGNALIAYRDGGNSNYGTFVIRSASGALVAGPTVFESSLTVEISAVTLKNGDVFIAHTNVINYSQYGTFAIYSPSGTQVAGPTVFLTGGAYYVSATALQDGNVLIAYFDNDNSGNGAFVIYSPSGALVKGPTIFCGPGGSEISAVTLRNANVLIAYLGSQGGTFAIYDSSGSLVSGPTIFKGSSTREISATVLANGSALISFRDDVNSYFGTFVIYNAAGTLMVSPTVFNHTRTDDISAQALPNGHTLIAYMDADNSQYGTFVIWGQQDLRLQKIDNNQVRLWNFTWETLELIISVNQ